MTIVYVDMDDVMCRYTDAHLMARRAKPNEPYPQSTPGFFRSLLPIAGATQCVNQLRELCDVYVLTAPSTRNVHSYSEKRIWIEEHFGYSFTKRLIISPDKGLLKGDYLIDDRRCGKGQDRFEGTLIEFGSPSFPTWPTVLSYLTGQGLKKS